jgi:hypothetical protein
MKRTIATPSPRARPRAALPLALALLAGCSSEPEKPPSETPRPPETSKHEPPLASPSERKMRMLLGTELAMRQVLKDARTDSAAIRRDFDDLVAKLPLPSMLSVTDDALAVFDQAARDARAKTIGDAETVAETRMNALLAHYESRLWMLATEASRMENGHELGTRSGYQELDDKVEAAMLQLSRSADVEGIQQLATLRTYDHVGLDREVREELPGKGVISLYKSQPVNGLFEAGQEGQAVVLVFQRDGLEPTVPLAYLQAVRHIVQRAGIVLASTPWVLDPDTPRKDGMVSIAGEIDPAKYFVSAEARPAVDRKVEGFGELSDHVVVTEYRTALRREDTGETLATIGWQVRWIVDFQGTMRVLVERNDLLLVDDPVLPGLLPIKPGAPARS